MYSVVSILTKLTPAPGVTWGSGRTGK